MTYFLPDKFYDVMKWVCLIALPAFAWAYSYFGGIWAWPMQDQIVGTITGIASLIGILFGIDEVHARSKAVPSGDEPVE